MKNIILNWFPPSMIEMPSPAMSVLKAYLSSKGYNVLVYYWNIKLLQLQREFIWDQSNTTLNETHGLLLFNNYLAVRHRDKIAYAKVKSVLLALKPQYLNVDLYYFDRHMELFAQKLDVLINTQLSKFEYNKVLYIGMSVNLYQWICGSIIAQKIKEMNPNIPIVVGGIGTKESAISFLRNFNQFDFALWGEGECSLTLLTECLNQGNTEKILNIPNLAIRNNNNIVISNTQKNIYANLNSSETLPVFDDYFEQLKDEDKDNCKIDVNLFIEGSRSCHWKKCRFCYLNTGYKHRLRDVKTIEENIRELIGRYNCTKFCFLDNDIIANDWERFSQLLDCLILIKEDYPDFQIVLAEIITKGINSSFIRKMSLAGFTHVQIGYESPSNNLLKKINKKNTFAANLLFIKYADKYNIFIGGANIICGLLEETDEDILEGIENLRYMRFFFQRGKFRHTMSRLGILNSSRYYEEVKNDLSSYLLNNSVSMLPDDYVNKNILSNCTLTEVIVPTEKPTWANFVNVEKYYLKSEYKYKVYKKEYCIIYKEYLNGEIINELEIEYSSLEYLVLKKANESVCTLQDLKNDIMAIKANENITDCEIYNILEDLKKEGLIYTPLDFSEIVTVFDIENVV